MSLGWEHRYRNMNENEALSPLRIAEQAYNAPLESGDWKRTLVADNQLIVDFSNVKYAARYYEAGLFVEDARLAGVNSVVLQIQGEHFTDCQDHPRYRLLTASRTRPASVATGPIPPLARELCLGSRAGTSGDAVARASKRSRVQVSPVN